MAVDAVAEWNPDVARHPLVAPWSVALFTADFVMQPGKGIAGKRMVEIFYIERLPFDKVMALEAVSTKPAFVLIPMTSGAVSWNAEKRLAEIGHADGC